MPCGHSVSICAQFSGADCQHCAGSILEARWMTHPGKQGEGTKGARGFRQDALRCQWASAISSNGHAAMIFSQWVGVLDLLSACLFALEVPHDVYAGWMTSHQRNAWPRVSVIHAGPPVVLVSSLAEVPASAQCEMPGDTRGTSRASLQPGPGWAWIGCVE